MKWTSFALAAPVMSTNPRLATIVNVFLIELPPQR
jgi:hypothetical protein